MVGPWSADERACAGLVVAVLAVAGAATSAQTRDDDLRIAGRRQLPATGAGVASVRAVAVGPGSSPTTRGSAPGASSCACRRGPTCCWPDDAVQRTRRVDRKVDAFRVASGTSRRLRLSLRRRGGHAARKRKGARAAGPSFVSVTYPAVWVQHFAVSGPDEYLGPPEGPRRHAHQRCGSAIKKRCDGVVVEREHLDVAIAEQKLSQSRYADPSQRIPSGHLIGHNRVVSGTLTVTGATATLTVTVTNTATGLQRSVTHTGASGVGIFDLEKSVVDDVAKLDLRSAGALRRHRVRLDPGLRGRGLGDLRLERDDQPGARSPGPRPQRQSGGPVRLLPPRGRHRPPDAGHGRRALHGPRGDRRGRGPEPEASAPSNWGSRSRPTPSTRRSPRRRASPSRGPAGRTPTPAPTMARCRSGPACPSWPRRR